MWALFLRVATVGVGVAVNGAMARALSQADLGRYFLLVSLTSFAALLANLGTRQSVVKEVARSTSNPELGMARSVIVNSFVLSAVGSLMTMFGLHVLLQSGVIENKDLTVALSETQTLLLAWVAILALQMTVTEAIRGLHYARTAMLLDGGLLAAGLLISISAFLASKQSLDLIGVVSITIFISLLVLIFGLISLFRARNLIFGAKQVSRTALIKNSMPFLIANTATFGVAQSSIWIVGVSLSANEVAVFGAAWKLVSLVAMPILIVNAVVQPYVARLFSEGKTQELESIARATATIAGIPSTVVIAGFLVFGGSILSLVYGQDYERGAIVLAILGAGHFFNVITGSCDSVLAMTGNQRLLMMISITSAACTIALGLYWVSPYGIEGVAWATTIGRLVQNLLSWSAARKFCGVYTHVAFTASSLRAVHTMITEKDNR